MRFLFLPILTAAGSILFADGRVELDISASVVWTDTRINLNAGETVNTSAGGFVQLDYTHTAGPEGLTRTWADLTTHYPVMNAGRGALIARFGDSPAAQSVFRSPFGAAPSARVGSPVSRSE